nr:protein SPIRRIG [Ipomoea batatas]GMD71081.1 protein SPIRRIG [Ipomoea batatas]
MYELCWSNCDIIQSLYSQDGINLGANLLYAVEVLVSGPTDKQSLLDSGILCCLIHILNSLLGLNEGHLRQNVGSDKEPVMAERNLRGDTGSVCWLEVVSLHACSVYLLLY